MRKSIALMLVLSPLLGACGKSMMYKTSMDEFRNPNIPANKYDVIAVLPMQPNSFDAQVAGRARARLKAANIKYVPALKSVEESELAMEQLCPTDRPPEYKGVLFVTWDRIILRDCETKAVAFRVLGNYAGIDKMLMKFESYLKTKSE